MNKRPTLISLIFLSLVFILILSNLASAVIFDIAAAREREWERFEDYKQDYIKFNDLEAFSGYVNEANLARNFGFYGPDYYYIPPDVLAAKYNPPLQGEFYQTTSRGYDSSLNHPSAIKYYGNEVNGRYAGYIPSTLNGRYFDHPHAYGNSLAYGDSLYRTASYPNYRNYDGYAYQGYDFYGYDYKFKDSEEPAYYARIAEPLTGGFYVVGFY